MYALIYDDYDLDKPEKQVFSVHATRDEAQKALDRRQEQMGLRVWQCHTRIVWLNRKCKAGDYVTYSDYSTWRPGEKIPGEELYPDTD